MRSWPRAKEERLKITVATVFVGDQEKALRFYTEILGFLKKTDIPMGKF